MGEEHLGHVLVLEDGLDYGAVGGVGDDPCARVERAEEEQRVEKIRRQKRRRSRRAKAKMLAAKREQSEKKQARVKIINWPTE